MIMIELGLSRIAQLVKHTPLSWKAIHVAGTNGKGSITAYLSAVLKEAGVVTGRFNSPHLIDRWDCISIQDQPVSKNIFTQAEDEVKDRDKKYGIRASEFELLTATAFEVFNRTHVQVGVVEVGLGGRLDATNILQPHDVLVSVISKIGLDHQTLLGQTLEAIAGEKGGIMKEAVPCIVDGTNESCVLQVLHEHAKRAKTTLSEVKPETAPRTMKMLQPILQDLNMAPYQQANILLAIEAARAAEPFLKPKKPVDESLDVTSRVTWPGRLQKLSLQPLLGHNTTVLLDGAHNIQAAESRAAYIDQSIRQQSGSVTWILAVTKGKDLLGFLGCILKPQDKVIATTFGPVDGMPWVEPVENGEIVQAARRIFEEIKVTEARTVEEALCGFSESHDAGPVVITGSLYLVADVLRLLRASKSMVG